MKPSPHAHRSTAWLAYAAWAIAACAPNPEVASPSQATSAPSGAPRRAVATEVPPPPSAPSSSVASAPPVVETSPSATAVSAATEASATLDVIEPGELRAAERVCEASVCRWRFPRARRGAGSQASISIALVVDPRGDVVVEHLFDDTPSMSPRAYVASKQREGAILDALAKQPDVDRICRRSRKQGAPCVSYTSRMGRDTCPKNRSLHDDCLWEVYVGSNMGSHASRLATFHVDPGTLEVVGASDLGCPVMKLATFRARWAASQVGAALDDCPSDADAP